MKQVRHQVLVFPVVTTRIFYFLCKKCNILNFPSDIYMVWFIYTYVSKCMPIHIHKAIFDGPKEEAPRDL